jgi:hypothetical protein
MTAGRSSSAGGLWRNCSVGLLAAAGFVFFARLWFLFLPVNVLGRLLPLFDAIGRLRRNASSSASWTVPSYLVVFLLLFALAVGGSTYLYYRLANAASNRSTWAVMLFAVVSALLAWLLWPMPCNSQSSFWGISDRTCNCIGMTFSFYPPLIQDGVTVEYCLGWEKPVSP